MRPPRQLPGGRGPRRRRPLRRPLRGHPLQRMRSGVLPRARRRVRRLRVVATQARRPGRRARGGRGGRLRRAALRGPRALEEEGLVAHDAPHALVHGAVERRFFPRPAWARAWAPAWVSRRGTPVACCGSSRTSRGTRVSPTRPKLAQARAHSPRRWSEQRFNSFELPIWLGAGELLAGISTPLTTPLLTRGSVCMPVPSADACGDREEYQEGDCQGSLFLPRRQAYDLAPGPPPTRRPTRPSDARGVALRRVTRGASRRASRRGGRRRARGPAR